MPVVVIGDLTLNQSNSILRFFGSQHGLYPDTPLERYYADWAIDTYQDWWSAAPYRPYFGDTVEEDKKKEIGEKFAHFCDQLEKRLNTEGAKPFLGGSKISIGDIKCYPTFALLVFNDNATNKIMVEHLRGIVANYPAVTAWVATLDAIFADYYAAHPKTIL